ncbi:MAG: glycosyltransferase family 4 protein [Deltaproteobacteria bacterium]|jgi:1,2-diacylglycerol 3-alpha-glucosyltransferase
MAKWRVALISDWYYPKLGGIEYSLDALARSLSDRGHTVHIITRKCPGASEPKTNPGISVIRVTGRSIRGAERFLVPKAYKELSHTLKKGNYDVVNAHGLDSPLGLASLVFARRLGLPVVVTNHSLVGKRPLTTFLFSIARFFLKNADALVAVSSAVEQESRRMARVPIYRIPNGIEIPPDGTGQNPIFHKDGKIVVATVARMTKMKGVGDLVDVASHLLKDHANLLFLMIGEGPLRKKLEGKVKGLRVSGNFHFTGEVPRERVLQLLEQADIFVLPSRVEAFGISVLEAFAKKVPVVARNHGGVSDLIAPYNTGLLANNNYEMEERIQELISNPGLRGHLSTAAVKEIDKYRWPEIAERVEEVYTHVIHEKTVHHH